MQRYDQSGFDSSMTYDDDGEYVLHGEAAARIAELEAERDRLAAIVERARNGYPQLIDWIDDFMAAEAATKETK